MTPMLKKLTVWRYLCLPLCVLLLSACGNAPRADNPDIRRLLPPACPHWAASVFAPKYMEAWVETLEVKDERGRWIKIPHGMAGDLRQTEGWGDVGAGGGPRFEDAGAPMEVYIRWQSLAEPQTYTWRFTVPESVRKAMKKQEQVKLRWKSEPQMSCRSDIAIGVAPGGRVIAWNAGLGFPAQEILRGQADIEPLGPYQGLSNGKYRPMHDEARRYVDEHGIPYGSWDK